MNGQERAEENVKAFAQWVAGKTSADFREMVTGGQLNRGEISRECNFSRSVLVQNPRIKDALHELENRLRLEKVLPQFAALSTVLPLRPKGQLQAFTDTERLKKFESENAGLKAEVAELRQRLKRYEAIESVLAATGRLPR